MMAKILLVIRPKRSIRKRLGNKDNFLNTATDHLKGSISQPIVFKIAETGKRHETIPVAAGDTIISRPAPRAGK